MFANRLKQHGINPRGGRNTAMIRLAYDLPAAIAAEGPRGRSFALVERYWPTNQHPTQVASNFTSYAANTNGIRTIPVLRLTPEAR